jgi:sarcosine oxidase subunit delta
MRRLLFVHYRRQGHNPVTLTIRAPDKEIMIIKCPYCGPRDVIEFTYQGDATRKRPDPASTDTREWSAYVYERSNPSGAHKEFWLHSGGCRQHLLVTRDMSTHAISSVVFAREARSGKMP